MIYTIKRQCKSLLIIATPILITNNYELTFNGIFVTPNCCMRKHLPVILFLFFSQNLLAQVKGVIVDSATNLPVDKAVVALVTTAHISDTSYTITSEKGEFFFEKVPSSNFSVIITNIGYKSVTKFIPVEAPKKTIDLENINIINSAKILNEVVIEASPITIKEDTIEYRADAFKVKQNAVVEDLLKKLPGVQVDKDGNIKAQGKSVTKVKVNGKDFFGGDPKTATKELPANIVDKVQIIDDYGDQAAVSGIKEGEADKVMNIQLKKDKNTGYFGRVTAGVGDKERYLASFNGNYFKNTRQISVFSNSNNTGQSLFSFGGSNRGMGSMISSARSTVDNMGGSGSLLNAMGNGDMGFFQGGNSGSDGITTTNSIGINYRDDWSKKLSVYGSYSYSHRNSTGYRITSQQNFYQSKTFLNDQNNQFVNTGESHRFYFNIEYNIDSLNYIKISPGISYSKNNGNSNTNFDYYIDGGGKTSEGYNNNLSNSNSPNLSANILYNHRFHKRGRNFSININSGNAVNTSEQDSRNHTIQYVSPAATLDNFLYNKQENTNTNYSARLTYSEPISKEKSLDVAYSHNFSYSRNNKQTYNVDPSSGIKNFNYFLSNDYENNYNTDRANISLRTTYKRYNYTLGISLQPVNLQGYSNTKDSAYTPIKRVNVFPVARFAYNFSKTKSLNINYRGDAQQPGFSQLQDVIDSSNLQYLTRGNPNLKPSINHNISLFYNDFNFVSGRVLFTSVNFSTIQNQIINNVIPIGNSGAQLTMPQNVNGYYNVNAFYNYSRPYKNRMYVFTLNGNVNYNNNINLINSIKNIGRNWVASQGMNFELNYKDWLEFGLGGNYSVNSVTYKNTTANANFQNQEYSSWVISSTLNMDLPGSLVLKYDFDYTINQGLTGAVGKNIAVMNASLEKQLFSKKNGIIRLQAFDLFNQNSNISRTVTANSIIDSRTNRLNRYFMLSFTYRLQKFAGKQPQQKVKINSLQMPVGK